MQRPAAKSLVLCLSALSEQLLEACCLSATTFKPKAATLFISWNPYYRSNFPSEENSTRSKGFEETMKATEESQEPLWPSAEQINRLREKLHDRIAHEELESSWRLEALDRLLVLLQMEPTAFDRLWVQPLRAAGATMDEAVACITASYFLPN
jgi:hypothetical protein